MQSFSPGHVSAVPLTHQGIAALKSGDSAQAYDLLTQALQANPRDEQAWLWLSGVVTSDAERHYCLGRVLQINPQNGAAQRGLSLLPAGLAPISPLPGPAPVQVVEPPPALIFATAPTAAPPAQPAVEPLLSPIYSPQPAAAAGFAATSYQPFAIPGEPDSLLAIIDGSPSAAPLAPQPALQPAPPPALPAPVGSTYQQADIDFVVRQLGSNRTRDEVSRMLCEQKGYAWTDAQDLVVQVGFKHRTSIARRQSPFLVALGVATIIGGIALTAYASVWLYSTYTLFAAPQQFGVPVGEVEYVARPAARSLVFMVGALITGISMMIGASIGVGQTVRAMWK